MVFRPSILVRQELGNLGLSPGRQNKIEKEEVIDKVDMPLYYSWISYSGLCTFTITGSIIEWLVVT